MLDLLYVVAGIAFFVVSILYIYGCEWFVKERNAASGGERIEINRQAEPVV